MPILTSLPVEVFDQESFHQIDRIVTGIAFDIQNEFGRYLLEPLYQKELTRRCRGAGLVVVPEFRITATFDDFGKDYYADHLINQGVIVECKAVTALASAHRGQTLNYLFLCGLQHGTLLNFRTERVEHEFVSTRLTPADRMQINLHTSNWTPYSEQCTQLYDYVKLLLEEWGAFLDPLLYRDALIHLFGGPRQVERFVPVRSGSETIGTQPMHLHADDVAFSITASVHQPESIHKHQQRFLAHTDLQAIQWLNFNHHNIELRTITRP